MKMQKILMMFTLLLSVRSAAALDVFACEPEWAALAQELGGDRVEVFTASAALQDPHRIEARPTLIAKLRQADLLVCTGADLETGWLPMLLRKASNDQRAAGKAGPFPGSGARATQGDSGTPGSLRRRCACRTVIRTSRPTRATSPRWRRRWRNVCAEIDAAQSASYAERHRAFAARWQAAMQRWEQQAAPLRGVAIVVQHKSWV